MNHKLKLIIPIYLGTLLEWYDFSIFMYLAPVMSHLFFSSSNPFISTLMTYAVFGIGFIARPLGGLFFGRYADNYGRKKSMLFSMFLITGATATIGLLPTYEKIGMYAPLTMVLLRLIQGFCIGGESTGSALYMMEMQPMKHRGILTSFMWSAAGFGMLMGSLLTAGIFNLFTMEQVHDGLWRLPFLFSLLTGVIGFYFRKKIPETHLYQVYRTHNKLNKEKLRTVIQNNKRTIVTLILLYALSSIITYLLFVFMPAYMNQNNFINLKKASLITTVALSSVTLLVPLSGYLSDLLGRKFCLYTGAIGFLVLSIPLYHYMNQEKTVLSFIISDIIFVILAVLYQGALTATAQELVSTRYRYTVTSIGYNISYGLFGGTAPLLVSWIAELSDIQIVPGIYLTLVAFLALLAVYKMNETYKERLE